MCHNKKVSAYNYAAAFLLFSQGNSLEDISIQIGIPLVTLEGEARQHGWKRLCHQLKLAAPPLPVEKSIAAVQKNRLKSLSETEPLEKEFEYILKLNDDLRNELVYWQEQVDKTMAEMGAAEADHRDNPTPEAADALRAAGQQMIRAREIRDTLRMYLANPKRFKELALGLAQVQELRYRAVGDMPNVTPGKVDPQRALTQVIVNMPSLVAKPRQVVDVQPVAPPNLPQT